MRSFFKKRDIIIILAILLVAAAGLAYYLLAGRGTQDEGAYAEIFRGEELEKTVSLNEDTTFELDSAPNVVFEVKDGKIAFVSSDCPDQTCIYFGWQTEPFGFAACLPNNIIMWVQSPEDTGGVDAVAN